MSQPICLEGFSTMFFQVSISLTICLEGFSTMFFQVSISLPISLKGFSAMFFQVSISPLCISLLFTLQDLCHYTHLCFVLLKFNVNLPCCIGNFSMDLMDLKLTSRYYVPGCYTSLSSRKHDCAYNICPLEPHFYSKTGVCRGIHIFLIFAPKHSL